MKTPNEITRRLENLVGSSALGYSNDTNLEDVYDEMCKEIDKTCEVVNRWFKGAVVWVVMQTQTDCDYTDYPIAVYASEKDAYKLSRMLNKRYGLGCWFSPDGDYQDDKDECESRHYYTVGRYVLNPEQKDFL